jgi:polar amino acid transport system permease protein
MGFDFSYVWAALPTLALAAKMNVLVTLLAFTFSLTFGTVLALLRRAELRGVTGAIHVYISFIRGTPVLVQIFIVYYVLPVAGIDLPPLSAGVVAIGLNSSAFVAEIVRAGINGIPKGQFEASAALGLRRTQQWRLVILPQVFRMMIPALMNEFTIVLKASPIVSMITVVEVLRQAQQLFGQNYRPFEMMVAAAIVFFILNFTVSQCFALLERRGIAKLA